VVGVFKGGVWWGARPETRGPRRFAGDRWRKGFRMVVYSTARIAVEKTHYPCARACSIVIGPPRDSRGSLTWQSHLGSALYCRASCARGLGPFGLLCHELRIRCLIGLGLRSAFYFGVKNNTPSNP
jgi:hypothetical protein